LEVKDKSLREHAAFRVDHQIVDGLSVGSGTSEVQPAVLMVLDPDHQPVPRGVSPHHPLAKYGLDVSGQIAVPGTLLPTPSDHEFPRAPYGGWWRDKQSAVPQFVATRRTCLVGEDLHSAACYLSAAQRSHK